MIYWTESNRLFCHISKAADVHRVLWKPHEELLSALLNRCIGSASNYGVFAFILCWCEHFWDFSNFNVITMRLLLQLINRRSICRKIHVLFKLIWKLIVFNWSIKTIIQLYNWEMVFWNVLSILLVLKRFKVFFASSKSHFQFDRWKKL